ncbi:MAG TPA: molybdopterin-guanine dinucleotide biosynthesis protein B [Candidatus Aminicenantes bacterium]|nr:molybdopterin-guanine dinucleotide biosynthesis protein B [Candidatus Aminicenantes bacterium]
MKLVSFVGFSDSGKTTVVEQVAIELKKRGYQVGVIKHCPHGFDLDKKDSDSHRMWAAGAEGVGVVSSDQVAIYKRTSAPQKLRSVAELNFPHYDFVLIEGGKDEPGLPKIEVWRKELSPKLITARGELVAVVSDDQPETDRPVFNFCQLEDLVDFLEKNEKLNLPATHLWVDDRLVPLKPFVQEMLEGSVLGMVKTLKKIPAKPRWLSLFIALQKEKNPKEAGKKPAEHSE